MAGINVNQGLNTSAGNSQIDANANYDQQSNGSDLAGDIGLGASTNYTNANAGAYNSLANTFGANAQSLGAQGAIAQSRVTGNAGPYLGQANATNQSTLGAAGNIGTSAQGVNQGIAQNNAAIGQNNAAYGLAMNTAQHGSALAQNQLQQATDQGIQAQMALANSSQGGASQRAGALRNAQAQGAQAQAGEAAQSGQLQAQTQAQGLAQAGSLAGQSGNLANNTTSAYGTQGNLYGAQGGLTNSVAGLQSSNAQNAAQDNLTQQSQQNQYAASLYGDQNTAQTGALNSVEGYNQAQTAADQIGASEANQNSQTSGNIVTGALSAAGSLFGLSDQYAKTAIHDGDDMADEFLRSVDPKGYHYKDAQDGQGQYLGVMAQDLERVPGVGHTIVKDGADGRKRVDMWAAQSATMAGIGRLNERLEKLEKR